MIIVNSGFWIALGDNRDKHHKRAVEVLKTLDGDLITTVPVMTEVCHILLKRRGVDAQLKFIASYERGAFELYHFESCEKGRLEALMQKY